MPRPSGKPAYLQTTPRSSPSKVNVNSLSTPSKPTESAYHRQIRALIVSHRQIRKKWMDLVLVQGLGLATRILAEQTETKSTYEVAQRFLSGDPGFRENARQEYLHKRLAQLESLKLQLLAVLEAIGKETARMEELTRKATALLIEASKTKSIEFAFTEPLWTTWPMQRFVESYETLTDTFTQSNMLLQQLAQTILAPSDDSSEKQGAISFWACQPLLLSENAVGSAKWLEEILEVEIPEL